MPKSFSCSTTCANIHSCSCNLSFISVFSPNQSKQRNHKSQITSKFH
nr:MAG TPA: hypothetical protein [Caudoviricetes sp.]